MPHVIVDKHAAECLFLTSTTSVLDAGTLDLGLRRKCQTFESTIMARLWSESNCTVLFLIFLLLQMDAGEGRFWAVKSGVVLLFLLVLGGLPDVAPGSSTLVYRNTCLVPVFPSLIPTGDSVEINNTTSLGAIAPYGQLPVPLPDDWFGFGFVRTGCISTGMGFHNCTSANCEGRDCTAQDLVVATIFSISSDGYIISVERGYNVGLAMEFMCNGCSGCPSARCKAQLGSCPNNLRVFNSSGAVAACMPSPGSELHFSEDECIFPGDYTTSRGRIPCQGKNLVIMIIISC
ncbi:pathogenesis-related protein 5-like isoform X2 [Eucalyptus grandis]|uniref:pathogenesis-related protein 5-like isoform X2 n=1 Tax=Eucalyptus grandis TaxID=71139 RepID=UPI00192EE7CF|nr:pathogenesis-related protein 5-like isoform X2 [Eucalyptus grandis]